MLSTEEKVRDIIGLSEDDAPDAELERVIEKAQKVFLHDVASYVQDDTLSWYHNDVSSNVCNCKTFLLTYPNVADRNFDGTITIADVSVYLWTCPGSFDTKTSMAVSSINLEYGFIVTSSSPTATSQDVTAAYYYYPRSIEDDLISDMVATLAAFYYVKRELLLVPESMSHGAYRFRFGKPFKELYEDYLVLREKALASPIKRGEHGDPVLIRTEVDDNA